MTAHIQASFKELSFWAVLVVSVLPFFPERLSLNPALGYS